jgi:WXG100 family type VII secretion target
MNRSDYLMAKRIAIAPEQVRSVAAQFKSKSQESEAMVQQLGSGVSGLQSQWEGMAAQRFMSDFEQWKVNMKRYAELLNSIGLDLERIANALEATDQQLAGGKS